MKEQEFVKFELVLWFEPELKGSINDLRKEIISAINNRVDDLQDIELTTVETGRA